MASVLFLGEFESTLDLKGRFLFPVGFKKQIPPGDALQFVINRGFEKCLTLYTTKSWEPFFERVLALNEFEPRERDLRRRFLNGATPVEPDTAGRILLPQNLRQYAGLERDIVLVSAGDKIEIWDSNTYKQFFDSFSSDEFSSLAMEVLGNKKQGQ